MQFKRLCQCRSAQRKQSQGLAGCIQAGGHGSATTAIATLLLQKLELDGPSVAAKESGCVVARAGRLDSGSGRGAWRRLWH